MTTEALPLLRQVVRAGYRPQVLAARAWQTLRRTLTVVEQLPHDVSRLLRNARRGRLQVNIELAHLKRVGDQIDRAANRLAMVLVISALIIGASIVMTVRGGPTLFGLPPSVFWVLAAQCWAACGWCAPSGAAAGAAGWTTRTDQMLLN
jgi:ubiquinone biosynthesis protein